MDIVRENPRKSDITERNWCNPRKTRDTNESKQLLWQRKTVACDTMINLIITAIIRFEYLTHKSKEDALYHE